jgi:hypothetical protein
VGESFIEVNPRLAVSHLGHLAADAEEQETALLDAYDAAQQNENTDAVVRSGHDAPEPGA